VDNLRLILFISGVLVIAAIYAWEVFRGRRANQRRQRFGVLDEQLLQQNDIDANKPYTDTGTQYWDRLDQTVAEKDKVVLGNLDTLEDRDTQSVPLATDDPKTTSTEEIPLEKTDVSEEIAATQAPIDSYSRTIDQDSADIVQEEEIPTPAEDIDIPNESLHTEKTADTAKELFLALTIMAKPGRRFTGAEILEAFESSGMRFGEMDIFHHFGMSDQETDRPVLSGADILEPGTFPIDNLENYTTKGLILFMQLPGPLDGLVAFELMLNVAQQLTKFLDGELCDETRSTLTTQSANHLRERIEELKRKQLI